MIDQDIMFYHSKPEIDVKNRGKRMTVCAIMYGDQVRFGYCKLNRTPVTVTTISKSPKEALPSQSVDIILDNFTKTKGRKVSQERAESKPLKIIEIPPGMSKEDIRRIIVSHMKQIVTEHLWEAEKNKGTTIDYSKALDRKAEKISKNIVNSFCALRVIDKFRGAQSQIKFDPKYSALKNIHIEKFLPPEIVKDMIDRIEKRKALQEQTT